MKPIQTEVGDLAALEALANVPRTPLAFVPTPLLAAEALASALEVPCTLSVKLDAWTGFGLGGNKVRKLEFELAPERLEGVTRLITAGGPHSNHCRVTAAAAAHLGLSCTLVLNGTPSDPSRGNAALHRLYGADILTVTERIHRAAGMEAVAEEEAQAGGRGLVIPLGASTALGSLGYAVAFLELWKQAEAAGDLASTQLVAPSSSGGTLAGLLVGRHLTGWRPPILAVSADDAAEEILDTATRLAIEALSILGSRQDTTDLIKDVRVTDEFVGGGYGVPTEESDEAARLFGRFAACVLDPYYTAKAGAAFIDLLRGAPWTSTDHVIFLHTGGHPAIFR